MSTPVSSFVILRLRCIYICFCDAFFDTLFSAVTQKTVSNYRNKISNFESNAANCIKKLNLTYNQVVNKI